MTTTIQAGPLYVDIDASDVERELQRLYGRINDDGLVKFEKTQVRSWLVGRARARFEHEGDDASYKWQELSDATRNYRAQAGFPPEHPINVRTGELRNFAFTSQVDKQVAGVTYTQPRKGGRRALQRKLVGAQRGGRGGAAWPSRKVVALSGVDFEVLQKRLLIWVHK